MICHHFLPVMPCNRSIDTWYWPREYRYYHYCCNLHKQFKYNVDTSIHWSSQHFKISIWISTVTSASYHHNFSIATAFHLSLFCLLSLFKFRVFLQTYCNCEIMETKTNPKEQMALNFDNIGEPTNRQTHRQHPHTAVNTLCVCARLGQGNCKLKLEFDLVSYSTRAGRK